MFALNIDKETGRVLSATYPQYATEDMPVVETLPEGNIADYLYVNGEYVHEPIPKTEESEAPTELERLIEVLYKAGKLTEEEYKTIRNAEVKE